MRVLTCNPYIAARAKIEGTGSKGKLPTPCFDNSPFKAMPDTIIVPMVLEHVMKDERKKQVAAMAKVAPGLNAQKAYNDYRKELRNLKERLEPATMHSRRRFHLYVDAMERLECPPNVRQRAVDSKDMLALHEAGKNIETLGLMNKNMRKRMQHHSTRPLPNPTGAIQQGLRLFMKNEYKKHLTATNKVYHNAKLEEINKDYEAQHQMAQEKAYPPIVNVVMNYERMRSQEPHLAALGESVKRPFGLNTHTLISAQQKGMKAMQRSAMNIEKVGMINKEMQKYMQKHIGHIVNPNPRNPPKKGKKRKEG